MTPTASPPSPAPSDPVFDDDQQAFIGHRNRLVGVIAPPGAGKSTSLAHRYAGLVAAGVDPYGIAVMTFTNRARQAFEDKLRPLLPPDVAAIVSPAERNAPTRPIDAPQPLPIGTFHYLCARVIGPHLFDHHTHGWDYRICDTAELRQRIRSALQEENHLPDDEHDADKTIRNTANLYSQIKRLGADPCIDPRQDPVPHVRKVPPVMPPWDGILAALHQRLRRDRVLEPDDLPLLAYRLLHADPVARDAWARCFTHIMVDEYQDTDPLVTRIIAALGAHAVIDVCGDVTQSIYQWRDAVGSFRELDVLKPTHGDPVLIPLRTDYRLTRPIQEASERLKAVIADPDSGPPPLPSTRPGPAPEHRQAPSHDAMYDRIAADLNAIAANGSGFHHCAILARRNQECTAIAHELGIRDIPTWVASSSVNNAPLEALTAWLVLTVHFDDDNLSRAFQALPWNILPATIGQLRADATRHRRQLWPHLVELADDPGFPHRDAIVACDWIQNHVHAASHDGTPPSQLLHHVIDALGLEKHLADTDPTARAAYRDTVQFLHERARVCTHLDQVVTALASSGRTTDDVPEDHVQIRTMHSAKGLEFRHVLVTDWHEDSFPAQWMKDIEEQRRLAYVAITRASHSFTSYAPAVDRIGVKALPSRFLHEAGIPVVSAAAPAIP